MKAIIFFLTILCALVPKHCFACKCASEESPDGKVPSLADDFKDYGAVFCGSIVEMRYASQDRSHYTVKFEVHGMFKGPQVSSFEVTTHYDGGSCGYRFQFGESYLVWAERSGNVTSCGRTQEVNSAKEGLMEVLKVKALTVEDFIGKKLPKISPNDQERGFEWDAGDYVIAKCSGKPIDKGT